MDFRCFEFFEVEASGAGVLLVGDNARGKTTVLEALCVLVRLQSPRARRMATLVRHGAPGFGVAGEAWGSERQVRYAGGSMALKAEGEARAGAGDYLSDGGLVVWMGNEDLELGRGPGEVRRRYLDFLGSQMHPEYRRALSRYRRAVKARNLLLRERRAADAEIDAYDAILAEHGALLREVRAEMLGALAAPSAEAQREIGGGREVFSLRYRMSGGGDLAEALAAGREGDRRTGRTGVGPHRDDVALELDGRRAADFASEGQLRTVALALKLAQGRVLEERRGAPPVYLIDDVFGELDPTRRNALMAHLPGQAQLWITTTHLDWLDKESPAGRLERIRVE
jgi:DNA replication and repair protein RecF